eukprot:4254141-Amphidinium_carterae.1
MGDASDAPFQVALVQALLQLPLSYIVAAHYVATAELTRPTCDPLQRVSPAQPNRPPHPQ